MRKDTKKGETLFGEGEKGDEMYLIKKGKIRIFKVVEEGKNSSYSRRRSVLWRNGYYR